jgi:hypothetical protein
MEQNDIRKFAEEWITFQAKENPYLGPKQRALDNDPEFEVVARLLQLTHEDWNTALAITVEIANQSNDPWVLEILGASALEDILEEHGYRVLLPFLSAAKANPNFRQALRHIWERSDPYVWEQFLRVRDKLATPELPDYES